MKSQIEESGNKGLSVNELMTIEMRFDVYLREPKNPKQTVNQQFDVYDNDNQDTFLDHIIAEREFFTEEELLEKVGRLFPPT